MAFRICDLNKDECVEREEVLQVYEQVVHAMNKSGISTESYSDPRNLVRSVSRNLKTKSTRLTVLVRSSKNVVALVQQQHQKVVPSTDTTLIISITTNKKVCRPWDQRRLRSKSPQSLVDVNV